MYASINDPKQMRTEDPKKPPGFITETAWASTTLFTLKLYSDAAFSALSFMTVLIPFLIYFALSIVFNVLKFIKLIHTEEVEEDAGLLSGKQIKLLFTMARNLLGYFGLYMIAGELDEHITHKQLATINMAPAVAAIQAAFLIMMVNNHMKRRAYAQATGQQGALGFLGATGLTTVFNALTQTTTTLCANGQCFTIYSNTISSNLAAFGCTATSINTYLIPLCCLLLTYALWNIWKTKRQFCYTPFLLALVGACLIVFDNFLYGEQLQLHNIPSWIGNVLLIVGVIWSTSDNTQDQKAPMFGV